MPVSSEIKLASRPVHSVPMARASSTRSPRTASQMENPSATEAKSASKPSLTSRASSSTQTSDPAEPLDTHAGPSLPDFQTELRRCAQSETMPEADTQGTVGAQSNRGRKDKSQRENLAPESRPSLPVTLTVGPEDVRALRLSSTIIP